MPRETMGMTASQVAAPELVRYLDAIVELTRYRDPQELGAALLKTLRANLPGQHVQLLAMTNENRVTEFDEGNLRNAVVFDPLGPEGDKRHPLGEDADLLQCVRTQSPVIREAAGTRRAVLPIFGMHHVQGLLVIDGLRDGAVPQVLLEKLLRVYGNQLFVLSRGEVDPLTGLYNRQSFPERIRRIASRARSVRRASDESAARQHCFALLDIDNFKQVNDRFGHLYGDEVLLLFARLMVKSFRHDDLLFRYGGEEFAVVLVNVSPENAVRLLERFRAGVEAYSFPQLEPKTVSIGVTAVYSDRDVDEIVMRADKALYYAKNFGRNRVCCYETLVTDGKLEPLTMAQGDIELF
jgi:diguanylate cyclase (GGDEF)-like protein